MAEKAETKFRKKFVPKLKQIPKVLVLSIQQVAIVGTPDLLLCVNGFFVAIELKKDHKSEPTALQRHNLNKVDEAGGFAFVCSPENEEEVLGLVTMLAEKGASL